MDLRRHYWVIGLLCVLVFGVRHGLVAGAWLGAVLVASWGAWRLLQDLLRPRR